MDEWDGCPEGMYPMDVDYPNECENFADIKEEAEKMSGFLNFPISWYMTDKLSDCELKWNVTHPDNLIELERWFKLVFLMPRKYGKTWSLQTQNFDSEEVKAWLKEWIPQQLSAWYGMSLKDNE